MWTKIAVQMSLMTWHRQGNVDSHFEAYRKGREIFYLQLVYSSFVYSERFKIHSYLPVSVLLMNPLAISIEGNGKGSLYLHGAT